MSRRSLLRPLIRSPRRIAREVDEEIAFHLEARRDELEQRGLTSEAAREEAYRRFGDVDTTRTRCLEAQMRKERHVRQRERWLGVLQDITLGIRQLRRQPMYAAVAILTLGVGIGATTAVFSTADHVLLRPLPYADADRVVTLVHTSKGAPSGEKSAPANFMDWESRTSSFASMGLAEPYGFDLAADGPPRPLPAWLVTRGFFDALRVTPAVGRLFSEEEYAPDGPFVVVLSHPFWQQHFGGDPGAVGQALDLDGRSAQVVGVLPPGVAFPAEKDLWAPKGFSERERRDRRSNYMDAVARIKDGVSIEAARADMARVTAALAEEHPTTNADTGVALVPIAQHLFGPVRPAILVLLGAVGFVLLIACVNVASLQLLRGAERERELSVRAALGAGRSRLLGQLLAESAILAAFGGAAGLVLAQLLVKVLVAVSPPDLPRIASVAVDGRALLFTLVITVAATLAFGVIPSLRFSRPDLLSSLRSGGRSASAGLERVRARSILVVAEISLALVLLVGAGLLVRSFATLVANDPGFATENRVAMQLFLHDRTRSFNERLTRAAEIEARLEALPDVENVALVTSLPFHPSRIDAQDQMVVVGAAPTDAARHPQVFTTVASPDYFDLMEIPLVRGRGFSAEDHGTAPPVALVSETLVARHFPDEDPVGKRVTVSVMGPPRTWEIVGVVGDVLPRNLASMPDPEVFVPFAQSGSASLTFVVKTRGDAARVVPSLYDEIWQVDPLQAIHHASTLDQLVSDSLITERFNAVLLTAFSIIALLLTVSGVYGLISFSTGLRANEIGVRVAMGAVRGDIVSLVVGQALRLAVPGIVIGVLAAVALTRFMRALLYGVGATDPSTFVAIVLLVLGVSLLAAYVPARRASRLDPMTVLRHE